MIEENHVEPNEVIKERMKTRNQSCHVALLIELIKIEPSNVEESLSRKLWKEAMIEEY